MKQKVLDEYLHLTQYMMKQKVLDQHLYLTQKILLQKYRMTTYIKSTILKLKKTLEKY